MKKAYIFLAEGFEEIEGLTPVDLLRRAGIETVMVSVGEQLTVTGAHGISVRADAMFSACGYEDAQLLVLPGGMPGTLKLESHEGLADLLCKKAEEQVLIGAICAAPRVLGRLCLLEGKRAVCYPGHEKFLTGASVTGQEVEKDGNFVTSRGAGTAISFSLQLIRELKGETEAEKIRDAILYGTKGQKEEIEQCGQEQN